MSTPGLLTVDQEAGAIPQAALPASFGDVIGASAAQAAEDWPLLSAIPRMVELSTARRYDEAYRLYSRDGAKTWMAEQGLDDEFSFEDRGYNELELSILARRKKAELARRDVLARSEGGVGQATAQLATALGVSVLDPLNIASAFVPVVGEARYARLLAGAGGLAGRTAVRLGVGAVEGTAGAAALEPLLYAANTQQQADYGITDSLINIGFGGIFGGGLHAIGGAVGDIGARRRVSRVRQAVDQLLADPPANVAPEGTTPAAAQPDVMRAQGVPDAYHDRAQQIARELAAGREIDAVVINNPAKVGAFLGRTVESLAQFVKRTGGIADEGGELAARDVTSRTAPGLVRKDANGKASLDAVRERVWEAGYFSEKADYNEISDSELLDALAEDLFVTRRYPTDVVEALGPVMERQGHLDALREWGIEPGQSVDDIAQRLRALDDESQPGRAEADPDAVTEWQTAAARVDSLRPESREAMLRTAIAQTAQDQPVRVEGLAAMDRNADAGLEGVRRDAEQSAAPADDLLADPLAIERSAAELDAGRGSDELAGLQRQAEDARREVDSIMGTLDVENLPAEIRAELDSAQAFADEADVMGEAARMMVHCALRSAA